MSLTPFRLVLTRIATFLHSLHLSLDLNSFFRDEIVDTITVGHTHFKANSAELHFLRPVNYSVL